MKALWALEKATVHEIRAQLLPERPLAYTTVMTVMGRLVHKGVAEREKHGRSHLYRPLVNEESVREHVLNQFVETFFRGSRDELRRHLENGTKAARQTVTVQPVLADQSKGAARGSASTTTNEAEIDTSLL